MGYLLIYGRPADPRIPERNRQGHPISVEDAQIAAIALTAGFALATRNVKDFSGIEGLVLMNPWTD